MLKKWRLAEHFFSIFLCEFEIWHFFSIFLAWEPLLTVISLLGCVTFLRHCHVRLLLLPHQSKVNPAAASDPKILESDRKKQMVKKWCENGVKMLKKLLRRAMAVLSLYNTGFHDYLKPSAGSEKLHTSFTKSVFFNKLHRCPLQNHCFCKKLKDLLCKIMFFCKNVWMPFAKPTFAAKNTTPPLQNADLR